LIVAEDHPFIARSLKDLRPLGVYWFCVLCEIEQCAAVLWMKGIPGQVHFLARLRCRLNVGYVKIVGIYRDAADTTDVRVPTVPRSLADVTPVHGNAVP
jgi:hypothetical protein